MIEAIGYIAMAFTIGSFMARDMSTLRLLNSGGCAWWIVYGIGTGSALVILVNVIILGINMYHFIKHFRNGQ